MVFTPFDFVAKCFFFVCFCLDLPLLRDLLGFSSFGFGSSFVDLDLIAFFWDSPHFVFFGSSLCHQRLPLMLCIVGKQFLSVVTHVFVQQVALPMEDVD